MYPELISRHAREHNLAVRDAAQIFLQVVVLRHLSLASARFMGGTALVLGYQNPRFSEDVDLTQVKDPLLLKPGLASARAELERWFGKPVDLVLPKQGHQTSRLVVRFDRAHTLQLHIDSQPYKAHTERPLVIEFQSLPPFVCSALDLDEIMAEKIIAVAGRRYLAGRDLFDLWYHWLRHADRQTGQKTILDLVAKKIEERALTLSEFRTSLQKRLGEKNNLTRAREEWRRYLPKNFQDESVFRDIIARCRLLTGFFLNIVS